jgi:hypothetical protein
MADCRARTLGSNPTVLMSTRPQRLSGTLMTAMPRAASFSLRFMFDDRAVTTMLGATGGDGKA